MITALELTNELVKKRYPLYGKYLCEDEKRWIADIMIEFTKLHVQAALKEAFENAETDYTYEGEGGAFEDIPIYNYFVKKDSILNAYPESNIK